MITAIVGGNWGDEGKGKITDLCAATSHIVVRFQGGSNAGHTIINNFGKFALHQLPSGIFYENVANVIGNGVALNIEYLLKEMESVKSTGIDMNLLISERAQVLLPHHILLDKYEEERLGDRAFGSTKSGIAPFYSDKYSKVGIQLSEIYFEDVLKLRLKGIYEKVNVLLKHLYNKEEIDYKVVYDKIRREGEQVEKYVADTSAFLREAARDYRNILLEGQLGALKDTDHGIYPYVTSSSTLAGFAAVGAGISPRSIDEILVVTKAYSSAVGEGPFVSEIFGETAEELRRRGGDAGEYGATTGRPRRVGYFDCVATRYGCCVQGATQVALTGLDVLSYMDKIPVCTRYEIDGEIISDFPSTPKLYKAKPVYEYLEGFKTDVRGIRSFDALPENAQAYVKFIEKQLGVKISMVSNGPRREDIIYK